MWLHLLLCTTEMCHLAVRRYTHSSTAALTMKLFMILGALLLPATVEAKTYRPIQPLWGGQCAIPGVSDGSSSYCCTHSLPTLLTQQDCENKCNADANCVAYSWKISYNHCQVYDATGLPDLDAVVGSRSLSPPQGHSDANCYVVVPPPPPPPPPPQPRYTCDATGDPHYNTFFNDVHHFYGKGLFEHARFCTPTCGGCEVSIQTFLGPSAGNSLIKAIAARICGLTGLTFEFTDGDRVTIRDSAGVLTGPFFLTGTPETVWGPNGCGTSLEREADGWRLRLPGGDFKVHYIGYYYNTWLHVAQSVIDQPQPGCPNSGLCFDGCTFHVPPETFPCDPSPAQCYPVLAADVVFAPGTLTNLQTTYGINPSTRSCRRRLSGFSSELEPLPPPQPAASDASNFSWFDVCMMSGIDPLHAKGLCDAGCGATMAENCAYDYCATGDASFFNAYKEICAIHKTEMPPPPPPSPPPSILSCAALDDPTTCTEKDSKKVHRRCSPSAKPGWGGVGHKKCAKLCEKTDERLSAKCKQACCVTPPSSPSPSPPPPNPVATCPAGTFNNGEGTPTSPVCESCDQLLPPCDSCATLTHTRTRKPIHQPPHV